LGKNKKEKAGRFSLERRRKNEKEKGNGEKADMGKKRGAKRRGRATSTGEAGGPKEAMRNKGRGKFHMGKEEKKRDPKKNETEETIRANWKATKRKKSQSMTKKKLDETRKGDLMGYL